VGVEDRRDSRRINEDVLFEEDDCEDEKKVESVVCPLLVFDFFIGLEDVVARVVVGSLRLSDVVGFGAGSGGEELGSSTGRGTGTTAISGLLFPPFAKNVDSIVCLPEYSSQYLEARRGGSRMFSPSNFIA
jgi:hypothetical protein